MHGLDELHGIALDFGHGNPRADQMAVLKEEGGEDDERGLEEGAARRGGQVGEGTGANEQETQEAKNEFDTCLEENESLSGDLRNCLLLKVSAELDKMKDKSWTPVKEEKPAEEEHPCFAFANHHVAKVKERSSSLPKQLLMTQQ
eukprot:226852-Hanusia_phi.AAC.1